jgi:hypothetical protein
MKTQGVIKLVFAFLLAGTILQSCSKEDELTINQEQPNWTVRPDFATLDNRPQDVIALFRVTENDAKPVALAEAKSVGNKYALVIGISDYSGTANDLDYCDDDAQDWAGILQGAGYTVTKLLDLSATRANIEAAVNQLASQSIAGNEIALCYSGHGSKGNIVSTDLYYISSTWFRTKFANAKSTKMMFCFDACQIGAMATDLNAAGRVIAVASNKTSLSYDGDATMKNGVFTFYEMEWFGANTVKVLETDSKYACDKMTTWAKLYRIRVAPSYVDSFTGDFILTKL